MLKEVNTNIMQIEAKDIVAGIEIKEGNFKRYKGSLDYSLDAIKIDELDKSAFYQVEDKQYSNSVISVKFKYSIKNEKGKTIKKTKALREDLYENGFYIDFINKAGEIETIHYVRFKRSSGSSRVGKCLFIKEDLYKPMMVWSYIDICHDFGIPIDLASIEAYIALTTSSIIDTMDDIKKENILIIDEFKSEVKERAMATEIIVDDKGKDRLHTEAKDITIYNDIWDGQALLCETVFNKERTKDNKTYTYKDKGMLLVRNRLFKGACFNTRIQKFFEDAGITKIEELNGITLAKDIKDIKLICTKSCIKYEKFGDMRNWLNLLEDRWGIVKYDKPTHHIMGRYVSTHYQLLQTVLFNRDETLKFLEPTMDYINKVLNDTRVMRNHLKMKVGKEDIEIDDINATDEMIMTMLGLTDEFAKTQMYRDFRDDVKDSFVKNLKKGHVLIEGNYSVLFGNGMEMLKSTIKDTNNPYYFTGKSVLDAGEIHSNNFKYGIDLLGCRSPHVTFGNLLIAKNVECKALDTYFNLSRQILCVNSIGENLLERLSSCDFDSDSILLSNSEQLISKVKENYNKFLVPTSLVKAEKVPRENTAKDKCDLDVKTSVNKIGEIINLSQILNTYLADRISKREDIASKEIQDLYADISQLDIMSCIEIDKSKKEFSVNNVLELRELNKKYKIINVYNADDELITKEETIDKYLEYLDILPFKVDDREAFMISNDIVGYHHKTVKPNFMEFTGGKKKKKFIEQANEKIDFLHYNSTMCYLEDIVAKEFKRIKAKRNSEKVIISDLFDKNKKIKTSDSQTKIRNSIIDICKEAKNDIAEIWSKVPSGDLSEQEIKEFNSQKYLDSKERKEKCIKKLQQKTIKDCDIKKLLVDLSKETKEVIELRNKKKKDNTIEIDMDKYKLYKIGRFLSTVLFASHKDEYMKLFTEFDDVETLRLVNKKTDTKDKEIIRLYNTDFVVNREHTESTEESTL